MRILKNLFLILLFHCMMLPAGFCQKIIYVKPDAGGANDGSSWSDAFTILDDALEAANTGDQVWLDSGLYTPGKGAASRTSTFMLKKGVSVYGGFTGTETDLSERDYTSNFSVLSGEIGSEDIDDNCYHILTALGTDSSTVIDGLLIMAGNSNETESSGGGGIYIGGTGSLSVFNCSFYVNNGNYGAAIYNDSGSLYISSCYFISNAAVKGAGIANLNGSVTAKNCIFSQNRANTDGIAIYSGNSLFLQHCSFTNNFTTGISEGTVLCKGASQIKNCSFVQNRTYSGGGISAKSAGETMLSIDSTVFVNNSATTYGSAVYTANNTRITNCEFTENAAAGGCVYGTGTGSDIKIIKSEFTMNAASDTSGGGAVLADTGSKCLIQKSKFYNNQGGHGGAILIRKGSTAFEIDSSEFIGNISSASGGAMEISGTNAVISSCRFDSDSARMLGGALSLIDSSQILKNCIFIHNYADSSGGAIHASANKLQVINATIYGNSSGSGSGGGLSADKAPVQLTNTIVWQNSALNNDAYSAQAETNKGATLSARYSIIQDWPGGGTNVLNIDPSFSDTLAHLTPCSPAINTGTPDTSGLGLPHFDIAGNARITGNRIDIGAYEETPGSNLAPVLKDTSFAINENLGAGYSLGVLTATDPDTAKQQLFYFIISGNTDNLFAIDSVSGEITLTAGTDYETQAKYALGIRVRDECSNNSMADTAIITVDINDLPELASVNTSSPSNLTASSATIESDILNDGGSLVTERGICWSIAKGPTIEDGKVSNGTGTGKFTTLLTGLSPQTTYYAKAYAINAVGTSYSNEIQFTTTAVTRIRSSLSQAGGVLYPNPTRGITHVELQDLQAGSVVIKINNENGETVFEAHDFSAGNGYSGRLDLSMLPKGFYILEIFTDTEILRDKILVE